MTTNLDLSRVRCCCQTRRSANSWWCGGGRGEVNCYALWYVYTGILTSLVHVMMMMMSSLFSFCFYCVVCRDNIAESNGLLTCLCCHRSPLVLRSVLYTHVTGVGLMTSVSFSSSAPKIVRPVCVCVCWPIAVNKIMSCVMVSFVAVCREFGVAHCRFPRSRESLPKSKLLGK